MTDISWLGPPIDVRPLFARQQAAFIDLLHGFGPAQWAQPTACPGWDVKDIAAHVLGDHIGRLSRHRAAALTQPVPAVLLAEPPLPGVDTGPARAAWQRWASPPDAAAAAGPAGLRALADHLDQEITPFTRDTHALSDLASAEVAAEVASWCADAGKANDGTAPVTMIKAAETWLKAVPVPGHR